MRQTRAFVAASFIASAVIALAFCNCAGTMCGRSCTEQQSGKFFDASSAKDQTVYFEKVKNHFQQIGRPLKENEVQEHTAAVFIVSDPPQADVFVNGNFMGKTNTSQLYFKPGKQQVVFKKGEQESNKELDLVAGKNMSLVVKF